MQISEFWLHYWRQIIFFTVLLSNIIFFSQNQSKEIKKKKNPSPPPPPQNIKWTVPNFSVFTFLNVFSVSANDVFGVFFFPMSRR